ncbi:polysaccharide biosynthesis protein [Qipengyuania sp. CAU 1752]
MVIRLESLDFFANQRIWTPLAIAIAATLVTFWRAGLYRSLVRFVSGKVFVAIGKGILVFMVTLLFSNALLIAGIPRSVSIISGVLLLLSVGGLRFAVSAIFRAPLQVTKRPVVIYGAGQAGRELLTSLFHGRDYAPIAFVEDDPNLQGLTVGGCPVYSPDEIRRLRDDAGIEVVLLALPNITHLRRREIFARLEGLNLEVKTIPGLSDIISGKSKISELRNVAPEDLLGRDAVTPDTELLRHNIAGKRVMVSGAGGSIGSELCRQILAQEPESLVLYEISEFALFSIEGELTKAAKQSGAKVRIVPILGSVQNSSRLGEAIKAFRIQTIYHAAAYKHVPLVEENVVEGIRNNVFGTLAIANRAREHKVENLILISTDKAVRPTNIMGATKRIAELICQAIGQESTETTFSMVRFGNVLGSSGSVIPLFSDQIEAGGPVTVTHRDITRFFMTIPEASQLVIQAGAMAKGGDVFVLDMGEAVKIADLAVTMVKLHGLVPYFVDEPEDVLPEQGDIPICFTGLRKGEKLYEELLIGDNPQPTVHPCILTASEVSMRMDELMPILDQLLAACKAFDMPKINKLLRTLPLQYSPQQELPADLVWHASQSKETETKAKVESAA